MRIGRALGIHLDAWQEHILAVALEVEDDGLPAYREVRLSLGRQNGKTLLWFVAAVDRMLLGERRGWGSRQRLQYGAQNGGAAREKMLDTFVPIVADSRVPFDERRDLTKSNGRESFRLGNAKCSVLYGGLTAGHGGTNDMAGLDEAFSHQDNTAETGVRATMLTRPYGQLWVMSAAGRSAEESPYWWDKIDDGRERSESGEWGSVAYFEWHADDDLDRDDPAAWRLACPALASGRISEAVLRAERESMDDAQFDRSILNRWGSGAASLFPPTHWAACADVEATAKGTACFASVDVSPGPDGGRTSAIVVAGWSGEHPVVEVVAHAPGTAWVRDRLADLNARHRFRGVSIDSVGPVRMLIDDIRAVVGERFTTVLGAADVVAAAQQFHQAVLDRALRHRDDPALNQAVGGATKRLVGDSWAFRRRDSAADICPLVAASAAHRALMAVPREVTIAF